MVAMLHAIWLYVPAKFDDFLSAGPEDDGRRPSPIGSSFSISRRCGATGATSMDQNTYSNPKVQALFRANYIPVRVDQDSNPALSARYGDSPHRRKGPASDHR
jgi:Protein of unknown function, DUF255